MFEEEPTHLKVKETVVVGLIKGRRGEVEDLHLFYPKIQLPMESVSELVSVREACHCGSLATLFLVNILELKLLEIVNNFQERMELVKPMHVRFKP